MKIGGRVVIRNNMIIWVKVNDLIRTFYKNWLFWGLWCLTPLSSWFFCNSTLFIKFSLKMADPKGEHQLVNFGMQNCLDIDIGIEKIGFWMTPEEIKYNWPIKYDALVSQFLQWWLHYSQETCVNDSICFIVCCESWRELSNSSYLMYKQKRDVITFIIIIIIILLR